MKKITALAATLVLALTCLTSCLIQPGGGVASGTIFAPNISPRLIIETNNEAFDESEIWNKILEKADVTPILAADDGQTYEHEIIIGNTSHPVSRAALAYLESKKLDDDTAAFLLYVDGGSLAIVYNNPIAAPFALEYFYNNCLNDTSLVFEADYRKLESFSISAYKEDLWDNRWAVYDGLISENAISAMKALYGLFDTDTYMWMTSLYDAETGGFYFSESARDHVGFLPDVESTRQVLTFMLRMGLAADFNNDLDAAIPDEISDKMVAFVKGMQDPVDGYFYHPQWGKDITVNRRGRDLTWSKYILTTFGATAKYTLPDAPDADIDDMSFVTERAITSPLNVQTSAAVDKVTAGVIATASGEADFSSTEAFIAWLDSLNFKTNSHSDGQIFSAQASVIKARGYAQVALDYLYERVNPENGLWEDDVSWRSIGGLLKLSSAISSLGGVLPYPEESIRSCMEALLSDEAQTSMTCVYNCVNGASNVMSSMRRDGKNDRVLAIQEELRGNAENLIRACTTKILAYRNDNGSFSYWEDRTGTHAQGALVSLGVDDGELNGTLLATGSITGLVSIMGLPTVRVYGTEDYEIFINELLNAGEIKKNDPAPPEPYDFDDIAAESGDLPQQFVTTINGELNVIEDPRAGATGNILELHSKKGKGDSLAIKVDRVTSVAATCYVLSADMCFTDITSDCNAEPIQIYMRAQENSKQSIYLLTFNIKDGMMKLYDVSYGDSDGFRTDMGISIPTDEWFNLRIEYYPNVDENGDPNPRMKVIVTDKDGVKQEKISTNYFGPRLAYGTEQPSPITSYLYGVIYGVSSADMRLQMDNLYLDRTDLAYTEEGYEGIVGGGANESFFEDIKSSNARTENDGNVIDFQDFDPLHNLIGWCKNTEMLVTAYAAAGVETFKVVEDEDGDKHLSLNKTEKGASLLFIKAAEGEANANCHVFEMTVDWNVVAMSSGLQIGLSKGDGNSSGSDYSAVLTSLTNNASHTYFGSTIKDTEVGPAGTQKYGADAIKAIASGNSFTVRIEHYTDIGRAKLYINGTLVCDTDDVGDEPYTHVIMYCTSGFKGTINIDDVTATKIVKEYDGSEQIGAPEIIKSEMFE